MPRIMDTLITGSEGFIGSRLIGQIHAIGLDIKSGNDLLHCPLPEVSIVYHLASSTSVEESLMNPNKYMRDIVVMSRLVKRYPLAKIIYAQSASSLDIQSPYGFSKWACGDYLKKFHKNYVICTFPNVYGGGCGVIDIFSRINEVTIYGDGLQVRDFVHVSDIVDGLIKARDWKVGEYSMGSGIGTRIIDLVKDKKVTFAPARNEIRESILPNTTPNWKPNKTI